MSTPMPASINGSTTEAASSAPPVPAKASNRGRRIALTLLKAAISVGTLLYIVRRNGSAPITFSLSELRWEWFGAALAMQVLAIACGIARWRALLGGQGLHAPVRFLSESWMIGRFWGAVTPGGLGLDGWRFYDTVQQTQQVARAVAVAGVEKVLGQLGFGAVVLAGSIYGYQFIGLKGLLLVNGFFVVLVTTGLTLLARPQAFRAVARILPAGIQARIESLVNAVCAYHGKWQVLIATALLSMGVHGFNNLIYVCAAHAVNVELSIGVVFFASSLQIFATILPGSINGIGIREAAAVALYTSPAVGLTMGQALLIPWVGFAAEMTISCLGMPAFLLRRRAQPGSHFTVDGQAAPSALQASA